MRALDLLTGKDRANSPSQPLASVVDLGKLGTVTFNASQHWQRPGLTLFNNTVYAAFASHCDAAEFHPWIFAIDATSLQVALHHLQLCQFMSCSPWSGLWSKGCIHFHGAIQKNNAGTTR